MWAEANQYNPLHPPRDSEKYIKRTVPFFTLSDICRMGFGKWVKFIKFALSCLRGRKDIVGFIIE